MEIPVNTSNTIHGQVDDRGRVALSITKFKKKTLLA